MVMFTRLPYSFLFLIGALFVSSSCYKLQAQELAATVNINTTKLGSADAEVFSTLQRDLSELLNRTRWTRYIFAPEERIPCHFYLEIQGRSDQGAYKAHLTVSSRRPVYESSYSSPMLVVKDRQLNFDYKQYDLLEYNPDRLNDNLTAATAFYACLIIGLNMDSFGLLDGEEELQNLVKIKDLSTGHLSWEGWRADELSSNRGALTLSLTGEYARVLREVWYNYHRRALDRMTLNPIEARHTVMEVLEALDRVNTDNPGNLFVRLFGNAKLWEVTGLWEKAEREQKLKAYEILKRLYPTDENIYAKLKDS